MSTEQNKTLLRRFIDEILNKHNFRILDELIAPKLVNDWVNDNRPPDGFNQSFWIYNTFPDLQVTIEAEIAEGDMVGTRGYIAGTHQGDLQGVAPTGKQVKIAYIDLWRVENGKLVENWVQLDYMGMMQQLGLVPMPGQGS